MSRGHDLPLGLVGLRGRDPIGVHVSLGIKGPNGAPAMKGRFWLMGQATHNVEFQAGGGKRYSQLARDEHPAFAPWNATARSLGRDVPRTGAGAVGTLRGNLIHADWRDAALWYRSAQKLPEGHPNPKSRKPACEGNGLSARRFRGVESGEEVFDPIACPNGECPFAMSGLCKPAGHLIFMLRWDRVDPFQARFPALVAEWTSRGWESLANLRGLLELVLGTAALLTDEERRFADAEARERWKPGLAAEFGIERPSLVGMPFLMTVSERTKAADAGAATGHRFPVVSFSPDGDLVEWLLGQARKRAELSSSGSPPLFLPPATVRDDDFLDVDRHESRLEVDPVAGLVELPPTARTADDLWREVKQRVGADAEACRAAYREVLPTGKESTPAEVEAGFAALLQHPAFGDRP